MYSMYMCTRVCAHPALGLDAKGVPVISRGGWSGGMYMYVGSNE